MNGGSPLEIAAIIGLGNPGGEYAETRHNVGFLVVDELARRSRVGRFARRYASLLGRRAGARPALLVKPQTYMNASGGAVARLCRGESLAPEECLVVVDDVDLPLGELRLRARGGPGSHNGLRSIVDELGEGFPRLRLGIRGAQPWADLADYVLAAFEADERPQVVEMVARAADCVEVALRAGLSRAASRFNGPPASNGEPESLP